MLPNIIARLPDAGYLLVHSKVREVLWENRQDVNKFEAGGVLLGSYRGDHIEVIDATPPGKNDLRRRFEFIRRDESHQVYVDRQWHESEGRVTYIGEWHTHPVSNPRPSDLDMSEWGQKLPKRIMILCIQGINDLCLNYLSIVDGKKLLRNLNSYL